MKRLIDRGETLSAMAQRYGMDVDDLMRANPHIKDKDKIYAGDTIYIPIFTGWVAGLLKRIFG